MLPFREVQHRVLRFVLGSPVSDWRTTSTPELAQIADVQFPTVVAALQYLYGQGYLQLRKWMFDQWRAYTSTEPEDTFFYQAHYQLRVTPHGQAYFDELDRPEIRSKYKAYLDNDVVSALAKADMPETTLTALKAVLELFDTQKLELVTSDFTKKEIERVPQSVQDRWHLDTVFALLAKVPLLKDANVPAAETDQIVSVLQKIGVRKADAAHLMRAIVGSCDAFVTCDRRTILNKRREIERRFNIHLLNPEELSERFAH